MSSEQDASTAEVSVSFEQRLETMYERHHRRDLENKLEDCAETMESTILQQVLTEAFFDASIGLDQEAKTAVERTMEALQQEDYATVEEELSALKQQDYATTKEELLTRQLIEREHVQISNTIQELRLDRLDTVKAMRRLNDRVERTDGTRLEALEDLLDDWNWHPHVYTETAETFSERYREAETYGNEMNRVFDQLKEELFGPYKGTDLWPIVESLLDENRLTYGNLTETERQLLAQSDLAEHIELLLS